MHWPQVMVFPPPGPAGSPDGLQGALCSHNQAPGFFLWGSSSASLQVQACSGTAAFPWLCPISQASLPAPASSLGTVSHRHQWKTRPHQQLGVVLGLFSSSFFCNLAEMETADDLLQETVTESEVQGQVGQFEVARTLRGWGRDVCAFPLPGPWAFQEAGPGRRALRGCADLTCLCSCSAKVPRRPLVIS